LRFLSGRQSTAYYFSGFAGCCPPEYEHAKDNDAMRNWLLVLLIVLLLLAGCSDAADPGENGQLKVLTEDYPPFNFVTNDGEVTGQSTEIVRAIMNEVGVDSTIEVLPLAEALELVEKGPGVVLYSLNRTPERADLFKWVGPIGVYEQAFYARADQELNFTELDDAKKLDKIAVYEGDAGAQYLQDQGFKNLVVSPTDVEALQLLANGEVDLWLGNSEGLAIVAAEAGVDSTELIKVPAVVIQANLFIAFSKDVEDEVVQAWQDAFDRLKEERDDDDKTLIEKIEAKYRDPAFIEGLIN